MYTPPNSIPLLKPLDFIIHIPEFISPPELTQFSHINKFNIPVSIKNIPLTGYIIPYSPIALETIQLLTPTQILALFFHQPFPLDPIHLTLNHTPAQTNIHPNIINEANQWYLKQPINNLTIISTPNPQQPKPKQKIHKPKLNPTFNQESKFTDIPSSTPIHKQT